MKRRFFIISLILASLMAIGAPACAAYAVDYPYVVIGDNIWLLDTRDGSRIFLLPKTYYARVDDLDAEYYYVTFNGVSGKVERDSVSPIGYHTEATGTMQEIRIDPKYAYFTEIRLKTSLNGTGSDVIVPTDVSFVFLGEYPTETENWYYVRYNGSCGYVKSEFTTNKNIVISPFVPEEKPSEAVPEPEKKKDNSELIKILIITGLSVSVAVLLIIVFYPRKKGVNKYYYEDVGE